MGWYNKSIRSIIRYANVYGTRGFQKVELSVPANLEAESNFQTMRIKYISNLQIMEVNLMIPENLSLKLYGNLYINIYIF